MTDRVCRHGVPLRTTRVAFNDACDQCRQEREAFERQTRTIGGQLGKRYRAGEFDRDEDDHLKGHRRDPGMRRYWDDVRKDASEQWSKVWSRRRRQGMYRRALEVGERLQQPAHLPGWLDDLLTESVAEFTLKQTEALVLTYGYDLSMTEAAFVVGVKKQAYRRRLNQAQAKVRHLRAEVLQPIRIPAEYALSEDYVADSLTPLIQRQRRLERRHERLSA